MPKNLRCITMFKQKMTMVFSKLCVYILFLCILNRRDHCSYACLRCSCSHTAGPRWRNIYQSWTREHRYGLTREKPPIVCDLWCQCRNSNPKSPTGGEVNMTNTHCCPKGLDTNTARKDPPTVNHAFHIPAISLFPIRHLCWLGWEC